MELTFSQIAVGDNSPACRLERRPADRWLVLYTGPAPERRQIWRRCQQEQDVLIPLVPYLLAPQPGLAIAFALKLGVQLRDAFGGPVARIHLALGEPLDFVHSTTHGERWRCWLGCAVLIDSP